MTLELLICTIDRRIGRIETHLLPPRPGVSYLISWQHTDNQYVLPSWVVSRPDVRVVHFFGKGLSCNRNHALEHAQGDILKICDDDEIWENEYFDVILETYEKNIFSDIIHFQAVGLKKKYPPEYVSSIEMTMRRDSISKACLRFDERFGLGSPCLMSGEEEVFLCDARRAGLRIHYESRVVCRNYEPTTGTSFYDKPAFLRSKGAVFYYTRGLWYALYKALRESLGQMIRHSMNPLHTFRHMLWGINYIRRWQPSQS
ncbi:MAG: glycosyltransferase [Bacteroidaceae bacterium]|nr:glycosyltransferase [Bacteroidaceae bacterium]